MKPKFAQRTKYFIDEDEMHCLNRFVISYTQYKFLLESAIERNASKETIEYYYKNYLYSYINWNLCMNNLREKYDLPNCCNHKFRYVSESNYLYVDE